VTWNCSGRFTTKWATLIDMAADLAVIQECEPETVAFAADHGWGAIRTGSGSKGLAVLASPGWGLHESPRDSLYSCTARVTGPVEFTLVGFWALTPSLARSSYLAQGEELAAHVSAVEGPVVVAGDFNTTTEPRHLNTFAALEAEGLVSAFHQSHGVERGAEPDDTYFHHWHKEEGFHIDLMFLPHTWEIDSVTLGTFEKFTEMKISDHVPLIVDVDEGALR